MPEDKPTPLAEVTESLEDLRNRLSSIFDYEPITGFLFRKRTGDRAELRHSMGYLTLSVGRPWGMVLAHRAIWLLNYSNLPAYIDHRNGDKQDNRLENLRACTMSQNLMNMRRKDKPRSGERGVYWSSPMHKWEAIIMRNYKAIRLGYFDSVEEAAMVRRAKEKELFDEFARA